MARWQIYQVSELIAAKYLEIGDGYRAKNDEMASIGLPFIRAGDVNGSVNTEGCDLLGPEGLRRVGNKASRPGDVVLTTKGTIGRLAYVDENTTPFVYSPQLCFWRSLNSEQIDGRFLFFALQSTEMKNQMEWSAGQTDMAPYISLTDQRSAFVLSLPNIREQREIAEILGAIDDKINLNRRLNGTLEAIAQAIFSDWFIDFGPVRRKLAGATAPLEIMGRLVTDHARASDLARLFPANFSNDRPTGWWAERVIDQADWINGAAYKQMHFVPRGEGIPVIKIAELKAGVTSTTGFTNTNLGAKYRIDDGDLLFSWSGNPDTSIDTFIWAGGPAWLNQHIFAVRPNGCRDRGFLFSMLKYLNPTFAEIARDKQTTGLGHVTKEDLKRLQVTIPDKAVEAEFNEIVAPMFTRIQAALLENRTLAEARDYLLPRLMSGEVRVGDAAKEIAA